MPTETASFYTGAFPTITANDLKYVLYATSDPLAEVDSQTFAPPHPARTVVFSGLEKVVYNFKLLKMSGGSPVDTLIDLIFEPNNSEFRYRDPEILEVGSTPGLVDGATSFTFDGTAGTADWRGWTPIMQPPGFGPLLEGYNYTWDPVTGLFTLVDGTTFSTGVRYLVEFEPITASSAAPPSALRLFTGVMEITANTTLTADDMGKKILINPASPYIVITMPDIATVVAQRVTFFETVPQGAGNRFCVEIAAAGATEWQFGKPGRTKMYMLPDETFEAYKYELTGGDPAWRVQNAVGNYLTVGRSFASDQTEELNAQLFDGSTGDVESDARIWNDFVLQLDGAQVCSYADWESTPANQTKWSLQNGDTPAKFHFPDRRNLHERNTAATPAVAGVYQADQLLKHKHVTPSGGLDAIGSGGYGRTLLSFLVGLFNGAVSATRDLTSRAVAFDATSDTTIDGDENRVKNYSINRFVER